MTRGWSLIVGKRFNVVNVVIGCVSLWWDKKRWKGERERERRMSQARVSNEWKPRGRKERPDFALTSPNDLDFLSPDEAVLQPVLTSCYILSSLSHFSISPISPYLSFWRNWRKSHWEGEAILSLSNLNNWKRHIRETTAGFLLANCWFSFKHLFFIHLISTDFRPLFPARNFLSKLPLTEKSDEVLLQQQFTALPSS